MESANRITKGVIFGIIGLGLILTLSLYFGYSLNHNRIYKGVSIGGVDVSGLTRAQASEKIKGRLNDINKTSLTLKHGEKVWQVPFSQFNARYNVDEVVDKAYSVGRNEGIIQRISYALGNKSEKSFDIAFGYDKQQLINIMAEVQKEIDVPKKDARLVSKGSSVEVLPHSVGKKLDFDKAVSLADEHITKLNSVELELPVAEDNPTVLSDQLSGFTDELGYYSTTFNTADAARTQNIKLACSRINGTVLSPGQVFSMDAALKNRTAANGYKMSKAYLEDEVVDEIGGGVCQVTTTLYDAALYANLNIIQRTQHSMMVDYVSPGFDAAVSDKGVDLKFRNQYKFPIYLSSAVEGNKIIMKVFGKKEDPSQRVQLESEVTDIIYAGPDEIIADPSLSKGAKKAEVKSRNGYKAALYKVIYKDGEPISRDKVSDNLYLPRRGKIRVGI